MKNQEITFLSNGKLTLGVVIAVELNEICLDGTYMCDGEIYTVLGEDFITTYKVHEHEVLSVNLY